ncbi:ead/Ea22-like family protein [Klebsiella oxytoca]|uniref:ead/Ea22-like family protein n=1 Tax=Klebsiella TaxID=570 RepID=UPI002114BD7C|nr:ead/Ea22-like family protein [Klebsiella grimontii]
MTMTTDITELAQSLKAVAMKATPGQWVAFTHADSRTFSVHTPDDNRCGDVIKWAGFDGQRKAKANAEFIALANPANILALVEALEKAQRANDHLREQSAEWERKAISNFQECATMSERIYLLESRTVTVKMPEPFKLAKSSSGLTYYYADEVNEALSAAGIKWEAE